MQSFSIVFVFACGLVRTLAIDAATAILAIKVARERLDESDWSKEIVEISCKKHVPAMPCVCCSQPTTRICGQAIKPFGWCEECERKDIENGRREEFDTEVSGYGFVVYYKDGRLEVMVDDEAYEDYCEESEIPERVDSIADEFLRSLK